jgi:hypothetical protein
VLDLVLTRVANFPLGWAAALYTVAQLADLLTASRVAHEYNPLAAALLAQPLAGFAMKAALVASSSRSPRSAPAGARGWPGWSSPSASWPACSAR